MNLFTANGIKRLLLSVMLTVSACQSPKESKERLTVNITTEPPTLDPTLVTDSVSMNVLLQTFEGLTRFDQNEIPQPALAEHIEISEDMLTYTFHLRESFWSDGTALTAHDIKGTWTMLLDPKYPSAVAYRFYDIKNARKIKLGEVASDQIGLETPDDRTLVVTLEHPTPHFLELTALPTFYPLPIEHVKAHPNWASSSLKEYVSNGPFIMKEWKHEDQIVLEKNPHYWDKEKVHLSSITMLMIGDPTTEFSMFEMGEIQWFGAPISSIPPEILLALKKESTLYTQPANAVEFLLLNVDKAPLNNVHIRRALAYAIDRQQVIDYVLQNDQKAALSLVPESPEREALSLFPDHAIKQAKQEFELGLQELGISKEQFPKISYTYNTSQGHKRIAEIMQNQWSRTLGIKVELDNTEWKLYLPKLISGDFQIARMGWIGEYRDPNAFLYTFKEPPHGGINLSNFDDAQFREWMDRAEQAATLKERMDDLDEAEKRLIDQMPIVPLFYTNMAYVKDPRLKGVHVSSLYSVDFKEAYLE